MEHLPEFGEFLSEACRVLKGGSKIMLSFPLINPVREALHDFIWHTEFGMIHLCSKAGLKVIIAKPLGGRMADCWLSYCMLLFREEDAVDADRGQLWRRLWRNHAAFRV